VFKKILYFFYADRTLHEYWSAKRILPIPITAQELIILNPNTRSVFLHSTELYSGALKMTDMKLQDMKLTDRLAGHEIAGHENGGPNSRT